MFLEDDDLDALNAPLRDDEPSWDEDTFFFIAPDVAASAYDPAVA